MLALTSLLAGPLAACAPRPGPEVLTTVPGVPGAKVVTVEVATTRQREAPDSNVFTARRARETGYAAFRVSLPPNHQPGRIEWPTGTPDPATSFAILDQSVQTRQAFLRATANARGPVTVFVHGYNYNFQESLFRLAQLAADANVGGVPVLFAWPSEAKLEGYAADRESVAYSRDALVELLTELAREPGTGKITVLGHSMGGWLVAEAVRQLRLMGRNAVIARLDVVLAAPDIDVDVFRAQLAVIGRLSPPLTLLVSRDDVALSLSGRISGDRPRVGALDVDDPRVQEAAAKAGVQVVDISSLKASDGFNHDRFTELAALYPRLESGAHERGRDVRQAGAFIFNAVGTTVSAPFGVVGRAIAGE
ncbi:hypothetical protein GCM10007301_42730 [Azorhizobium oxalatiphilum]|uniref:Esterase/lipase superfamily enzyme n=1 Tax=Azorhizobium oxalatiphilum TaxID=980631 RepID=A0A917C9X0_9HYPH|nr:hypothetical protein GCM10007301_42730 [Azorhizobium oxalatiphilum]